MSMTDTALTDFTPDPRAETAVPDRNDSAVSTDDIPAARRALVKVWIERVQKAVKHYADDFKQMDKNEQIAAEGADEAWVKADNYTVPIIKRHIDEAVAQLYARDPVAVAKRRKKLLYTLWDGKQDSLQAAVAAIQPPPPPMNAAGQPMPPAPGMSGFQPDPNAIALLKEVEAAAAYDRMADQAGKTMEGLWRYFTAEQSAGFKMQMKAAVRRTKVCGVSYIKLVFQRALTKNPEIGAQIDDVTSQIAAMEALAKQAADGDIEQDSAKAEELALLLKDLQSKVDVIAREGPVFDFPRSKEIIPDPAVRHLKTLTGARWVAHAFDMTPEEVLETYKVNIKGQFKDFVVDPENGSNIRKWEVGNPGGKKQGVARIYEIQDKKNGQFLTVCEGYPDFLKEPAEPDVKIERFFTIFPLIFNEIEHGKKTFPPSDVYLARHANSEYNRSREGLREHRIANKPKYATSKGSLSKDDKQLLASGVAHSVLELKALKPGDGVDRLLQAIKPAPIDPNVYEVNQAFTDLQRTVGSQEADLGGTADASATQSSISENNRAASLTENVDDLDEMLSELAKATGQLMLFELSKPTVIEIVGPGAVWPDVQGNRDEIAKDLMLEIKAGSSGRPNRAAELANLERAMPYLLQFPGVPPTPIIKRYFGLLDIDLEEDIIEGMPSIQALNAIIAKQAAQPSTGDPTTDPAAQGAHGGQNAPVPPGNEPQAQPAHPAGQSGGAPGSPSMTPPHPV